MRIDRHFCNDNNFLYDIPESNQRVLPGISWGLVNQPFTPAYWKFACMVNNPNQNTDKCRIGSTLEEEVVACILGGHGVKGELGVSAFEHLKRSGIFSAPCSATTLEELLRKPLNIYGKSLKYRFPRQKAKYLANALRALPSLDLAGASGASLRNALTKIDGIGLKTASWIARNWTGANDVAILDIHVHRAGVLIGIFSSDDDIHKNYLSMENKYLALSNALRVPAGVLDHQIWRDMRSAPITVRTMLKDRGVTSTNRCGLPSSNRSGTKRNKVPVARLEKKV